MRTRQTGPQLLLEPRGDRVPAAGECPDHDAVRWIEFGHDRPRDAAEATCHPMTLHGGADRLSYNETDSRTGLSLVAAPAGVHHKIAFYCSHPGPHRRPELCRPCHPVPRGTP